MDCLQKIDYKLTIALIALIVSIINLSWNILIKRNENKKKLLIQCSMTNENCSITITNVGKKPIYVRRIEIEEKENGFKNKPNIEFHKYSKEFEMNPIISDTWRNVNIKSNSSFSIMNGENKFKKTRIIIIDGSGKKYRTKWFKQNNL